MKKRNTKQPFISVYMPVYNTATYLPFAIESIQKQTHTHWELIIVDDCSTDQSWKIAQRYAKTDKRIKLHRNTRNAGVAYTANKALSYCTSTYIARMDSDDIALPHRLSMQLSFLQTHPSVVAVGGQCDVINQTGQTIGKKQFPTQPEKVAGMLFSFASVQQPTMMINAALLPANFVWYQNGMITAEEHELFFKLLQYGHLANVPDTVLKYRIHGANVSYQTPKKDFFAILKSRIKAVTTYGYKPSLTSVFANVAQLAIISLLPEKTILWLYKKLRGIESSSNSLADNTQATTASTKVLPKPTNNKHTKLSSLSLFFPLHNEQDNVATLTRSAIAVAKKVAHTYEVLLVNDGSSDQTKQIATKLAKKYKHVRVINQRNLGYGGALKRGFAEAKYEWIFFSDGDLQFDLADLTTFIPYTNMNQVVLGYRKKRADHWQRIVLAKMLKIWNALFFQFPVEIKDIDCAFKLFHRDSITNAFPLMSNGAMISSELIMKILDTGVRYTQVGVTHYPRISGEQTGAKAHVIAGAIKDTGYLFWDRKIQPIATKLDALVNNLVTVERS